jgi:hypothetical protein
MKKFKISVWKDQKKYTLVFKAENEIAARERVHKEWYSILSIEEFNDKIDLGNSFSFKGIINSEEKTGKVMGDDIFKVYTKLRKELGYKVLELYSTNDSITQEEKIKQLHSLEEEYEFLIEHENKTEKKVIKKIKKPESKLEETNIDSFYMKKELEQTYKLIDFVLEKVRNLIENKEISDLDSIQKEKLKTVYNSVIKIKKTTNVNKLKEIWELALLKVGLLEVRELDLHKSKKMKGLLKDTNKLLKKIWSTKQFVEKDSDYKRIIEEKIWKFFDKFKKDKKSNKGIVDKTTHEYIRTELLIRKYKEKDKENTIQIIKNIVKFITKHDYREDILLRRKVIKQNLLLYKVKQKWINYSYSTIKKWYIHIQEVIESLILLVRLYIFAIIFFYSVFILIYINVFPLIQWEWELLKDITFNFKWLFYFILFIFVYLTLYIRKGFISLWVNFVILFFIVIFGVINF